MSDTEQTPAASDAPAQDAAPNALPEVPTAATDAGASVPDAVPVVKPAKGKKAQDAAPNAQPEVAPPTRYVVLFSAVGTALKGEEFVPDPSCDVPGLLKIGAIALMAAE